MNKLQIYPGQYYIPKFILLLICSYSNLHSSIHFMITCKKFYKHIDELSKIHSEFSTINLTKFAHFIHNNILADIINVDNFCTFKKHMEIKDVLLKNKIEYNPKYDNNSRLLSITCELINIDKTTFAFMDSKFGWNSNTYYCPDITHISKFLILIDCPEKTCNDIYKIIHTVRRILPGLLSFYKKPISKIHSIILAGRFQKIIIIRKNKKCNNKEDIIFNLNCKFN